MLTGTHKNFKDRIRSLMHFGEGVVLAHKMLNDNIEHIHAHYLSQTASVARVIYLLLGIPYSISAHAHDIWHDQLLIPEKLKESKFIVCCSEFGRQWLLKYGNENVKNKVHLVYHGIDVRRFVFGDEEKRNKNLILSVGRLTEQKGFVYLIEACLVLSSSGFEYECWIVGEGEQRKLLEKLINTYGLNDRVKLLGEVPQERIVELYHCSWVFVLPCIDTHDGNRDGIPNVLLESMATGLPIITTNNSGQVELIENEENGIIIPQRSTNELVNAIKRLCTDEKLRKKIKLQGRKRLEQKFDNRKTIIPLLEIFSRYVFENQVET